MAGLESSLEGSVTGGDDDRTFRFVLIAGSCLQGAGGDEEEGVVGGGGGGGGGGGQRFLVVHGERWCRREGWGEKKKKKRERGHAASDRLHSRSCGVWAQHEDARGRRSLAPILLARGLGAIVEQQLTRWW